jgi:DNA-binding NtrC family response regulator
MRHTGAGTRVVIGHQRRPLEGDTPARSHRPDEFGANGAIEARRRGQSGPDLQRDLAAKNDGIPIIFISAHGDIPMSVRAIKAGAVEFLPKPFRDQDLLDTIAQAWIATKRRVGGVPN